MEMAASPKENLDPRLYVDQHRLIHTSIGSESSMPQNGQVLDMCSNTQTIPTQLSHDSCFKYFGNAKI